jgi:hypothetical protein
MNCPTINASCWHAQPLQLSYFSFLKKFLGIHWAEKRDKQQAGDEKHHALQYIMYRDQNDDKKDIISHVKN